MRSLELKIPPPAVGFIVGGLMWLAKRAAPALTVEFTGRQAVAILFVIAGAMIIGLGVVAFSRAKTTVNPLKPDSASSLVVTGIYGVTRNPMYLGLFVILIGWAIFLSNALGFVCLALFILYMNRFQIEPEERALASLFGKEFAAYRSRVRRWL
ncbi:methyltransferase family protein [Nitrospira sp. Nam80]